MADNKEIVRRFLDEVIVQGDAGAFEEIVSPDFLDLHGRTGDDATVLKSAITGAIAATKEHAFEVVQMAAEGDLVFALANYHATLKDGTTATRQLLLYYRLAHGKIVENMVGAPA